MNRIQIKKSDGKMVLYKNGKQVATAKYNVVKQPYAWMPRGYKTEIESNGIRKYKGIVQSVADIEIRLKKVGK